MAIYRILSLDGGGVRGLLSAALLEQLERRLPGWLTDVDLIAGTSAGGIIACGLGDGMAPSEVREFFYEKTPRIFADSLADDIKDLGHLIGADYGNGPLRRELVRVFGTRTLGQLKHRVLIPAFDLDNGASHRPRHWRPRYFHNFPCADSYCHERIVDVALRTSAAPSLFPTADGYVDGGVVANNPAMVALSHTLDRSMEHHPIPKLDEIRLLSVGTGLVNTYIPGKKLDWGVGQWAMPLIQILMDGMIGVPDYQCSQLLGNQYQRLNYSYGQDEVVDLDDWRKRDLLVSIAENKMSAELDRCARWLERHWLSDRDDQPVAAAGLSRVV